MAKFIELTDTKNSDKSLINAKCIDAVRNMNGVTELMFDNGEIFAVLESYDQVKAMLEVD